MNTNIEYGFVSICLSEERCSPAGSVTVKQVADLSVDGQRHRILTVARRNLQNTLRIMWFLKAHDIELYRLSATLIPLATHELTQDWAWWDEESLCEIGEKIGRVARMNGYRLSSHLPELCGLTGSETFKWAQAYLDYHQRLFNMMGLDETTKIILHLGGAYGDKDKALKTAIKNLEQLSSWARARIVLENDDRTFTIEDVLQVAEDADVPVAFDWHHHWVNPPVDQNLDEVKQGEEATHSDEASRELLSRAFRLWKDRPPKVHLSSPKEGKNPRAHADYVDPDFLLPFWRMVSELDVDRLDVMVEAKMKDLALFRLREQVPSPV